MMDDRLRAAASEHVRKAISSDENTMT